MKTKKMLRLVEKFGWLRTKVMCTHDRLAKDIANREASECFQRIHTALLAAEQRERELVEALKMCKCELESLAVVARCTRQYAIDAANKALAAHRPAGVEVKPFVQDDCPGELRTVSGLDEVGELAKGAADDFKRLLAAAQQEKGDD